MSASAGRADHDLAGRRPRRTASSATAWSSARCARSPSTCSTTPVGAVRLDHRRLAPRERLDRGARRAGRAWPARAIAAAARSAPCPSSTSTNPTPTLRGRQSAGSSAGATATGHGAPCSRRSAVEPGATRPTGPRRVDPTTTRHASSSTAASWRTRAGDGPPRTMSSASMPPARRSSSRSASSRRSSSTRPALTALRDRVVQVARRATISGAPVMRASARPRRSGASSLALGVDADDDRGWAWTAPATRDGNRRRRCSRRARPRRHRVIATRVAAGFHGSCCASATDAAARA